MIRRGRLAALVTTLLPTLACSGGTKYIGSNEEDGSTSTACTAPTPPPAGLALDPFYERYLDAGGIPIVSSSGVSDLALERGCELTVRVLGKRADVHAHLVERGVRVAVIAIEELLTDIPEFREINEVFPGTDWNDVARSFGPLPGGVAVSVAEENLLCLEDDRFAGESLLLHSLGHGLRRLGIVEVDPDWDERLQDAYRSALNAGLWSDTHAGTNYEQYFAEGVQGWYDANIEVASPDPARLHNEINTRVELKAYDPALASLIAEHVPDDAWRPACLAERR